MRCPTCNSAAPPGARFCPACAAPLVSIAGGAAETRTSLPQPVWTPVPPPDGARFPPGTVLGERYRVVGLLGRGGMGEVYRADDLRLGRTVALKFLPGGMERDPARLLRLLNEVRTALRVTHPNVCRVHDLGDFDGRHYLSMEYVDGEDLAALLRRIGRLPEERAIQVARQLCAGLAAAHTQGVLHRDLKPANVMIDGRGEVKITDFGLAGAAADFKGEEIQAGTPPYMAPEQIAGREVTVKSDLYALGLVLYELFSGKAAFPNRRREEPPTSLSSVVSGLDPAVARVVERCLSTDPSDRPGSALAVSAALPGGDPLAAALAAGETPSPELVAEAGASGGLQPKYALPLLAMILLALLAQVPISRETVLASRVALDRPPEVLADKAREVIRAAGWGEASADRVFEFVPNDALYRHVRSLPAARDRWDAIDASGLLFAYRESPAALERTMPAGIGDWMSDPPPVLSGMVEVSLDTAGRLRSFRAVPPSRALGGAGDAKPVDWSAMFAAAGLDPTAFAPLEPSRRPPSFADRRYAWKGDQLLVEASSLDGHPVTFAVLDPWDAPADGAPQTLAFWERAGNIAQTVVFLVVVAGAVFVAARNVRLGRGDHRTALRLGLYLGMIRLLWLFGAHHLPSGAEIVLVQGHLAYALFRVGLAYVFYLALEPYARRLWPEMLVSWVRIFGGRFRDPRVGRDLLIGVASGCCLTLVTGVANWVPMRLGLPDYGLMIDLWSLEGLRGAAPALGALAGLHVNAVLGHFNGIMLFLVLRVLTRRTWIALAASTAVGIVLFNPGSGTPWPYLAGMLVVVGMFWVVLFRAGLLALLLALSVDAMISVRMTGQIGAWHALPMLLTLGTILAVAGWGFWAALAGRPLFRDEIHEGLAR